jgi:hypothetical protein
MPVLQFESHHMLVPLSTAIRHVFQDTFFRRIFFAVIDLLRIYSTIASVLIPYQSSTIMDFKNEPTDLICRM